MPKHILIVDDDPCSVFVIERHLRRRGYEVTCAADGEDGWAMIEQAKPDLIVSDCQMPRLDGLELAARVRAHAETAGIPIIMFTAKGFELSADEVRERFGIQALVPKPFHPHKFTHLIERIMEAPPVGQ